ncbi:MAG: tyrosine-type recombinase/integrase [Eubacteriaceae bacterium]|nr:tyrosine-type recombinase/integrase [Eubacteriaceae bacterium]
MKIEHLRLDASKPHATVIGKGGKVRTLYLLPLAASHLKAYLKDFHGPAPKPSSYVFYSRNKGVSGKMSQNAVNKQLKKHAKTAYENCKEVPLGIHAHMLRHAKASHWLEDGINIVQISFLLGHAQLNTTMAYLDITSDQEVNALMTLESENEPAPNKIWHSNESLASFCGIREVKS